MHMNGNLFDLHTGRFDGVFLHTDINETKYIGYGRNKVLSFVDTVWCIIVGNEVLQYPISDSEKYQNESPKKNRYE